uniref:Olfactory receptor n=1 Tax=Ursus americanus TaxID=9643 RepID=A0A452QZQ7_URSAM
SEYTIPPRQYSNHTGTFFFLAGLPGLEAVHKWLSIPLCAMYVASLAGNSLILWVVKSEPSLQQPMYYFLSMLAVTDLGLSASTLPTVLPIYMLGLRQVSLDVCLAQLFFIHTFSIMESSVLLTMALDRFVAISNPLRYGTILTSPRVASLGLASVVRSIGLHIPFFHYCRPHILSHSFCLHQDLLRLACSDIRFNSFYALALVICTLLLDAVLILISYVFILHTVLAIASREERLKSLQTCVSHICAVLVFYIPIIGLTMVHRFGKHLSPSVHVLMGNIYILFPPLMNPIIYSVKTQQIRSRMKKWFSLKMK